MGTVTLETSTIVAGLSSLFTLLLTGYVFLFRLTIGQWKESHNLQIENILNMITQDRATIQQLQTKLTATDATLQAEVTAIKIDNAKSNGKYDNLLFQISDLKSSVSSLVEKMETFITQSGRQTKP